MDVLYNAALQKFNLNKINGLQLNWAVGVIFFRSLLSENPDEAQHRTTYHQFALQSRGPR